MRGELLILRFDNAADLQISSRDDLWRMWKYFKVFGCDRCRRARMAGLMEILHYRLPRILFLK